MFQCGDVIFIVEHRFVVTCIFRGNLIQEALRLIFRVIQLAKAVTDFTTTEKNSKRSVISGLTSYDAPAEKLLPDIQ